MKEPKGEMSEKNLLRVAEIFWEGGGWTSQNNSIMTRIIGESITRLTVTQR